ncbi:MAG: hypothetical protein ACKOCX_12235, partial [Planctomycetota bacterium]
VETMKPFVDRFEDELRKPAGNPQAAAGRPTTSPLEAMWEGVRSAAAWTGAGPEGQGGAAGFAAQPAGGAIPGWTPLPTGHPATAPAQPSRPTASGFSNRPAFQQAAPGQFPVGAQTPLPIR